LGSIPPDPGIGYRSGSPPGPVVVHTRSCPEGVKRLARSTAALSPLQSVGGLLLLVQSVGGLLLLVLSGALRPDISEERGDTLHGEERPARTWNPAPRPGGR
jgi:hypothetical protein